VTSSLSVKHLFSYLPHPSANETPYTKSHYATIYPQHTVARLRNRSPELQQQNRMARREATEKSPADTYVGAIAYLEDITKIDTDSNIANMRANLLRDGSNGAVSIDMVRALEVLGIAKAVAARFSTQQHHQHAIQAAGTAGMFSAAVCMWLAKRNVAAVGEGDGGYRAFLLRHLDWVHRDGTFCDVPAHKSTCLCPVTAYLQLILRHTPVEDWAAAESAAAAAHSDASPLAFAWVWARKSPSIGRQTADVAVLVTMGRHIHRLMADVPVKAEEERSAAAIERRAMFFSEGASPALREVAKHFLAEAVTWLRASPSTCDQYRRKSEDIEAEELLATVRSVAEGLGEAGNQYAQLHGEEQAAQKRDEVVGSVRARAEFLLGKAEPPVPENVLLAVAGLAKAGS
jgi:hypothetical protein